MNEAQNGGWLTSLDKFNRHPIAQAISYFVGLLGIGLAVYFYFAGQARPDLTYYIHPARTVVVKAGEASDLTITHRGTVLSGNVSAANIAIWNAGREAIKSEDVLSPITISTGPKHPILEAKVRKVSRSLIGASLDVKEFPAGRSTLTWRILEQNDGMSLQVIYSGDADVPIVVAGSVIGQSSPSQQQYSGKLRTPEQQYEHVKTLRFTSVLVIFAGVLMLSGAFFIIVRFKRANRALTPVPVGFMVAFAILGLLYIGVGAAQYYLGSTPSPPFGF
jgi:hypothetical protein